jgi:phosphate transport system substrate-binding protein
MKRLLFAVALFAGFALAQDEVRVDGSSTVYPISLAVAEEFSIENPDAYVSVAFSGTGGGFSKFCAGETQVSDASRIIKPSEIDRCAAAGIDFVEIPVAFDALTVVVHPENDWATCMTVAELNAMWAPDSTATLWSDIRDGWPDEEMVLYAPGVDSGTFDYFTEAINGDGGLSRTDFFPSEDDNVLVAGVEGDVHALGYFGYAYYLEEGDRLNAVHIDGGDGCIEPSTATIESGTYAPLARPLFIYVSVPAADDNTVVQDFVEFYLSEDAREFIADTGYALLDDAAYEIALERFHAREPGSLFIDGAGKTVLEVLRGE